MLEVQTVFKKLGYDDGKTYLKDKFDIKVDDTQSENYIILNYSQIYSPKFINIVNECRGLILNKKTFDVASQAFYRFYNYNEDLYSKDFDICNAKCLEKIDGSLISIWFDPIEKKDWIVSTRSRIFADGLTNNQDKTFSEIVETAFCGDWKSKFNELFDNSPRDYYFDLKKIQKNHNIKKHITFIFEMVSPDTRIIKYYKKPTMYLIGMRNNDLGSEISRFGIVNVKNFFNSSYSLQKNKLNIELPEQYDLFDISEIIQSMKDLNNYDEGYVCIYDINKCDKNNPNYWRLKIKNPSYLAFSKIKGNGIITHKKLCTFVFCKKKMDEYLEIFPEYADLFLPYISAKDQLINDIIKKSEKYKHISNQKTFALEIKDEFLKPILFNIRKANYNYDNEFILDIITKLIDEYKIKYLEHYLH